MSLCAAAVSSGATGSSTSGHGSSPATPAPGVPTADFTERPFAPLQIVHDPAGAGARAGGMDAFLDALAGVGVGGIVTNSPFRHYMRDAAGWDAVRDVVRGAAVRGMRVWLYDEEGYPSGAAGGAVLADRPELEAVGASWAWLPLDPAEGGAETDRWRAPAMAGRLLGAWRFPVGRDGAVCWTGRRRLAPEEALAAGGAGSTPGGSGAGRIGLAFERRLYEGTHAEHNYHASRRMVNVLHPEAGQAFVRATHERYAAELGALMRSVEAAFTDEPSWISAFAPPLRTAAMRNVRDPLSTPPVQYPAVPWAPDLGPAFAAQFGDDLLEALPLLFVGFGDARQEARRCRARFYALVSRLYGERYFDPIRRWSRRHGVASSGHVLAEEGLVSHGAFEGDLMAQLRRLDWPGCDVLSTDPPAILRGDLCLTARFAASAARLTGAPQVMCEISDHEQRQADGTGATVEAMLGTAFALCTLGVSVYTSYYPWEAYAGGDYRRWCEGAARACRIVRSWEPLVDVAVFYPIRAVWEEFVPCADVFWEAVRRDPRYVAAREVSAGFGELARALLRRHVPFDIVDEAAILTSEVERGPAGRPDLVCGGRVRYRVVVLPPQSVLSGEVQAALLRWVEAGGAIVAVGRGPAAAAGGADLDPRLVGGVERYAAAAADLVAARLRVLGSASPHVAPESGDASAVLVAGFRGAGERLGYMLANTAPTPARLMVGLPGGGRWTATDLASGDVRPLPVRPTAHGPASSEPWEPRGPGSGPVVGTVDLTAYGASWLCGPRGKSPA